MTDRDPPVPPAPPSPAPRSSAPRSPAPPSAAAAAWPKRLRRRAAALAVAGLAGCSSHTLIVNEPPPPAEAVRVLAVGAIAADDTAWARPALRLQRRLIRDLGRKKKVAEVRSSVPQAIPDDMLVISGHVTEASAGSDLMTLIVSDWVGGPSAAAELAVADREGRVLYRFSHGVLLSERVLDPTADAADLEAVIDELAAEAADAIAAWLDGRPPADTLF